MNMVVSESPQIPKQHMNWEGSVALEPARIVHALCAEDIVKVMTDMESAEMSGSG